MSGQRQFSGVCVYADRDELVLELLAKAKELAGALNTWAGVVVLGKVGVEKSRRYAEYGADRILALSELNEKTSPDVVADVLSQVVSRIMPYALLMPATKIGRELAAHVAQSLEAGCATECVDVTVSGSRVEVYRLVLGGGFIARQVFERLPAVISISPRRLQLTPRKGEGRVEQVAVDIPEPKLKRVETRPVLRSGVELEKAEVVVAAGRGIKKKEDLKLVEELASALGGELGCSRPLSGDLKWLPEDRHIGLSGKRVRPKLYVAVGISGQIQHVVGMRDSRLVVCINKDPNAPMHKEADYSVVGDLYKVVPALTQAIRRLKQGAS